MWNRNVGIGDPGSDKSGMEAGLVKPIRTQMNDVYEKYGLESFFTSNVKYPAMVQKLARIHNQSFVLVADEFIGLFDEIKRNPQLESLLLSAKNGNPQLSGIKSIVSVLDCRESAVIVCIHPNYHCLLANCSM